MDSFDKNKSSIKNTTQDLYEKVQEVSSETYNELKDKVESLSEQVQETASNLYEESKDKLSNLETSVEDCTRAMISKVRDKPLTSLLIAGGIGFIISQILKNK